MMEALLELDQTLFFWINNDWHNPFLDWLMPYWRNKYTWIPFYIFLLIFALWKYRIRGLFFILGLGATVAISDPLSSELVKKNVERVRPCNDTTINESVLLLVRCGGGYSFTSSHATNHFAVAVFLILTLGRRFRKNKMAVVLLGSYHSIRSGIRRCTLSVGYNCRRINGKCGRMVNRLPF